MLGIVSEFPSKRNAILLLNSHKYEGTFKMETYKLVRSECTSPQGSRRGKIEKQVVTTYRNTTEGVYSVKRYRCYQCCSSFVYHVL